MRKIEREGGGSMREGPLQQKGQPTANWGNKRLNGSESRDGLALEAGEDVEEGLHKVGEVVLRLEDLDPLAKAGGARLRSWGR